MTEIKINTTQNVNIDFTAASLGERILAYAVDMVLKIAYVVVVYQVLFKLFKIDQVTATWDMWSTIVVYLIFATPFMFYSLVLETWLEGQTLGKRLLKIKVVKIDGYQASFADYLMRWFFRIVDLNILWGMIAVVSIVVNGRNQRLGDMVAGTAVISIKDRVTMDQTILEQLADDYTPRYPSVIKLSDNDIRIVKETFHTAAKSLDHGTLLKLKEKVENVIGVTAVEKDTRNFIATVLKDYNYYTQAM